MLATTGLHAQSFGVEGSVSIEGSVINGWNQPKSAVPVVINLKDRKTTVASAEVIIGNQQVAYQLDDLDGDTHADELVFLVDLAAKESKKFKVTLSSQPQQQSFEAKVYADMMLDDRKSKHPLITSLEAPGDSYLYSEQLPGGFIQVYPNSIGEESKVNIEALFNTVHKHKNLIKDLFSNE